MLLKKRKKKNLKAKKHVGVHIDELNLATILRIDASWRGEMGGRYNDIGSSAFPSFTHTDRIYLHLIFATANFLFFFFIHFILPYRYHVVVSVAVTVAFDNTPLVTWRSMFLDDQIVEFPRESYAFATIS